jgi:phenylacetate-CoA ligase
MSGIDIIKKFIGSGNVLEKLAIQISQRFPSRMYRRLFYSKTFLYWSAFLRESEFWDREKLEAFQIEELRRLLMHAADHVPYYRCLFSDYGFKPQTVQNMEDLRRLPYLPKETLRDRGNDFVADNIPKENLIKKRTSGSTGVPVIIYMTREGEEKYLAFFIDLMSRVGYENRKKTIDFHWRRMESDERYDVDFMNSGKRITLSAKKCTDEWMRKYYEMIKEYRPQFIFGSRSVLLQLALFMRERELPPFEGVRITLSRAETMLPWQKRIIEEAFGSRVFSIYGMFEGVLFGGGCEHHDQFHMYPQYGITEFIDIDGNNHEIVGTGFRNYGMPLIRYRTGDLGVEGHGRCKLCNRNYQLIESIEGRMDEFLLTNEGGLLFASLSNIDSAMFENVKHYQLYQDEPGMAYLKVVKMDSYTDADTLLLEREMEKRFNTPETGMRIKIVFVDEIEKASSGKTFTTDQRLDLQDFYNIPLDTQQ